MANLGVVVLGQGEGGHHEAVGVDDVGRDGPVSILIQSMYLLISLQGIQGIDSLTHI